ncbi:hypothetical protein [Streptomyces sp. NPDC086782]|uniref:hypothetical protein n=1 Tax=Streptomyces sp. NPDC086782 TaxID=3365757 RepID=UPI00380E8059
MTREIDTKTPNEAATQPATVQACQQDRAGRNDKIQAANAAVQKGLVGNSGSFTARGRG